MKVFFITYMENDMLEKDLEDWIYNNPHAFFKKRYMDFDRWIGRQVKLGNGIADLIAQVKLGDSLKIIVIELKKDEITDSALAQVMRYKDSVVDAIESKMEEYPVKEHTVWAMVCGSSIGPTTLAAANAMGISVSVYETKFSFDGIHFTKDYIESRNKKDRNFAASGELDEVVNMQIKEYEDWQRENGRM